MGTTLSVNNHSFIWNELAEEVIQAHSPRKRKQKGEKKPFFYYNFVIKAQFLNIVLYLELDSKNGAT